MDSELKEIREYVRVIRELVDELPDTQVNRPRIAKIREEANRLDKIIKDFLETPKWKS